MNRRTMDVNMLADYLGVHTDTIYTMVKQKQIPHVRVRRRIFFTQEAIDSWMREQESANLEAI